MNNMKNINQILAEFDKNFYPTIEAMTDSHKEQEFLLKIFVKQYFDVIAKPYKDFLRTALAEIVDSTEKEIDSRIRYFAGPGFNDTENVGEADKYVLGRTPHPGLSDFELAGIIRGLNYSKKIIKDIKN